MKDDDIPVSDTDQLSVAGGPRADRTRELAEFSPTNSPLSAEEIERRKAFHRKKRSRGQEWTPRTPENIDETMPKPPPPSVGNDS